jgi:hypothetical protein
MRKGLFSALAAMFTITGMGISQEQIPPQGQTPIHEPVLTFDTPPPSSKGIWFGAEYLLWRIKDGPNPAPLATLGDPTAETPGAIGQPGTVVIMGASDIDYGNFSGGRFTTGCWLDQEKNWGVEISGFLLEKKADGQALSSDANGNPQIFRPLNDPDFGESTFFVSDPGFTVGSIALSSSSQLWGAEANVLATLFRNYKCRFTLLAGFRYLGLNERIDVSTLQTTLTDVSLCSAIEPGSIAVPTGTVIGVRDSFETSNQFFGGQFGARAEWFLSSKCFVEVRGQVALGLNHQVIDINGLTTQIEPGRFPVLVPAGVLATRTNASNTNLGHHTKNVFSVVPETQVRLGWQWNTYFRTWVGYDFLYMSNVVRPGNQISRTIDFLAIPTSCAFDPDCPCEFPAPPPFASSGFWAQGVTFGFSLCF